MIDTAGRKQETHWAILRKHYWRTPEEFEIWCWRRMEISWNDRVGNGEALHRVKGERNILETLKRGKANRIGHILRRNCLLKQVVERKLEGRTEVMGRRGRRSKHLFDDLKGKL
jgi:hypothetical protein